MDYVYDPCNPGSFVTRFSDYDTVMMPCIDPRLPENQPNCFSQICIDSRLPYPENQPNWFFPRLV